MKAAGKLTIGARQGSWGRHARNPDIQRGVDHQRETGGL